MNSPTPSRAFDRALDLVRFLRAHCEWDARQTPDSLLPYLLEEAHEVAEAIALGNEADLSNELGDLLLGEPGSEVFVPLHAILRFEAIPAPAAEPAPAE